MTILPFLNFTILNSWISINWGHSVFCSHQNKVFYWDWFDQEVQKQEAGWRWKNLKTKDSLTTAEGQTKLCRSPERSEIMNGGYNYLHAVHDDFDLPRGSLICLIFITAEFEAKYQELQPLGKGGCGFVFAGYNKSSHSPVSVKLLSSSTFRHINMCTRRV